ncbi:CPXCG motif-containing cysteine-rich protein [Thiomicrorhabdus sediminis]|uniref:CPXCG motif-containing cysteine-rich protein n=1 Tax=Thiomicrorhabdus sediminis TaxID=2580412 RepID=A0A4P9K4Y0_9GAMM|nr:CPXCG motif-containing cysteine-rich protein [Thiomicrorhabdus sediminis]QCU90045.1 CPXCG motif-containing cysteine-rich protein [Thiomicrorhabdus sediminis]
MQAITTLTVRCPYCGEIIEAVIDCSVAQQEYIEDCEVCCRPIVFKVSINESGEPDVAVFSEND